MGRDRKAERGKIRELEVMVGDTQTEKRGEEDGGGFE